MSASSTSTRNFIPMANKYERVILLIDMDCFYCQVEEKLDPSLKNQPIAVVQYNAWRGGGIIAVNYAARAKGVTRHMRGDEAKEQCPEIQLVKVPNVREKADLTKYREAGKDVANVLQRFTPLLERASVDEAYLDITSAVNKRFQELNDGTFTLQPQELATTYAVGFETIGEFVTTVTTTFITEPLEDDDNFFRNYNENDIPSVRQSNIRLLIGASIANEIRCAVKNETSYECSAGIAHNKILAKLACGMNKPNKQTILPLGQISRLFETLPIGKIKGLGAKFGEEICERLNVRFLGQLLKYTEAELQKKFDEKNGTWLYNICRGIDLEAVTPRFYSKSIGCCKKFPGRNCINGVKTLQHWLSELANEINERLEKDICENNRRAKQMVVSYIQEFDGEELSSSRSVPLQSYDVQMLAKTSLDVIKANTKQFFRTGSETVLNNPIKFLGISVGKFETITNSRNNIQQMFAQQAAKTEKLKNNQEIKIDEVSQSSTNLVSGDIFTNSNTESEFDEISLKELSNIIKSQSVKSLLSNPLSQQQDIENGKQFTNVDINTIFDNLESNSSNSNEVGGKDISPNGFFARSVKQNENASDISLKSLCATNNLNVNQVAQTNDNKANKRNSQSVKTLFSNALNKQRHIEKEKQFNNHDINSTLIQFESNSNDTTQKLDVSNEVSTSSKGFFARALKKKGNSSDLNLLCTTSCNELNEIINNHEEVQEQNNKPYNVSSEQIVEATDVLLPNAIEKNIKRKYDNLCDTEESNQKNYRSEYAEFALPELKPNFLEFINCSKCGTKVFNEPTSIQTHEDHHYAQEISKQQRHEFRTEISSKIKLKSPSNKIRDKKSKKDPPDVNTSANKTLNANITKFLKPCPSSILASVPNCDKNEVPESSLSNTEICDVCKTPVKIDELLEHKDFHMAKDLQRELNKLEVRTVEVSKNSASHSAHRTTKSSPNVSSRNAKVTAKPITQFFTQSNT